jgi:hypothetical protein
MKRFGLACLLLASPVGAFIPYQTAWKRNSGLLQQHQHQHQRLGPVLLKLSPQDFPDVLKEVVASLDGINLQINDRFQNILTSLLSQIQLLLSEEQSAQAEFTNYATRFSQEIDQWLLQKNPQAEALFRQVFSQISGLTINTPAAAAIATVLTYIVVSSVLTWGQPPPPSKPYPLQRYDPIDAQVFFDGKTADVLARSLEIGLKSLGFALALLKDKVKYVVVVVAEFYVSTCIK